MQNQRQVAKIRRTVSQGGPCDGIGPAAGLRHDIPPAGYSDSVTDTPWPCQPWRAGGCLECRDRDTCPQLDWALRLMAEVASTLFQT
ncbi:hypothetical protein [Micromonospora fulviviridis]|uniref:hypothetical protein n=1 Tax=Micromonospora fulviviridis TaxID=47860 RepID=UPI00379BDD39